MKQEIQWGFKEDQEKRWWFQRDTLQQYEEKGYITEVPMESADKGSWFLPQFPAIRMDKETTKTRIVFDAAAKSEGSSLNDIFQFFP